MQGVIPADIVCDGDGVHDDALGDLCDLDEGELVIVQPAPDGAFLHRVARHHKVVDLRLRGRGAAYRHGIGDVYLHGRERLEDIFFDVFERDDRLVKAFVEQKGEFYGIDELARAVDAVDIDGDIVIDHFSSRVRLHAPSASAVRGLAPVWLSITEVI